MSSFEKKIKEFILSEGLFSKGERIILGVSGGADSICLLHILHKLRYSLSLDLIIAHLDHNLRKGSSQDELFVKKTAEKLNLPYITKRLKPLKIKKGSIEDYARKERLKFFAGCAKKFKTSTIVLAHNQDDLAETILMKILRGTGTKGLAGILATRTINELKIVRPLLQQNRKEIIKYLGAHRIKFVTDPTNNSLDFTRNKIRHQLLPLLEKDFNPNIRSQLATLSDTVSTDLSYLQTCSQKEYSRCLSEQNEQEIVFDLKKLKQCHPAILRMVLREAAAQLKGDTNKISFSHLKTAENILRQRSKSSCHWPRGIILSTDKKFLRLTKA